MKLGVMAALFGQMSLDEALDYCQALGLDAIELPIGAHPGDPWDLAGIHKNKGRLKQLKAKLADHGLTVSGIAAHGNVVHPDQTIAKIHIKAHRDSVALAAELGCNTVINFSGCPGASKQDKTPNWITCPWPDEFSKGLVYQWEQVLIPFWSKENEYLKKMGVRMAFEAHPGFCVYNPETLLKLRNAAGKQLGANLDPSHFFWQGIDPIEAARCFGQNKCLYYVHAKDCYVEPANVRVNGVLDGKSYGDVANRSWVFRTVGYGHDESFWRAFISTLRLYGYDGTLSIEHEDSLMSMDEGLGKAVAFLKPLLLREKVGKAWWF